MQNKKSLQLLVENNDSRWQMYLLRREFHQGKKALSQVASFLASDAGIIANRTFEDDSKLIWE